MDDKNTAYLTALAGLGAQPDPVTRDEALLNAIADRLDAIEEGGGLPEVTAEDNGDVLTVVDGAWAKAAPSGGGGGVFLVTFTNEGTQADPDYAADKTLAEVLEALEDGLVPVGCYLDDSVWQIFHLRGANSDTEYPGNRWATFDRTVFIYDDVAYELVFDQDTFTMFGDGSIGKSNLTHSWS